MSLVFLTKKSLISQTKVNC